MRKFLITGFICTLFLLSGCEWSKSDYYGAGVDNIVFTQPYTNELGYLTVNYNIKEVSSRDNNVINEFDFSGPMNTILNNNSSEVGSSSSTVIVDATPVISVSINPNLPTNPDTGYCSPVEPSANATFTSGFGPRWGTVHKGADFAVPVGTPVYAIESGTVEASYLSSSAGEYIIIAHDNDINGNIKSEYMHNSQRLVSVGDHVEKGQLIAYSGNTGYSTGPHVHIGLRDSNDNRIDPVPYLPTGWYN